MAGLDDFAPAPLTFDGVAEALLAGLSEALAVDPSTRHAHARRGRRAGAAARRQVRHDRVDVSQVSELLVQSSFLVLG